MNFSYIIFRGKNMFVVEPTKTQLSQYESGYMENVKLNAYDVKFIISVMESRPDYRDIFYSYITGKGKYSNYSKDYLKREYKLSDKIKRYRSLEREYRRDLEEAILDHFRAEDYAKEEAEMEHYREKARVLIRNGDIESIARALKAQAHQLED